MDAYEILQEKIRHLYNKLAWINGLKMKDAFADLKSSEVHCLEFIHNNPDSNMTQISKVFYLSKGAISKITKKLISKGMIESYQKSDNNKEIYFKLTKAGKKINDIHKALHNEFKLRDKNILEQLDKDQFAIITGFIDEYSNHLEKEIHKLNMKNKSE